MCTVAKDCCGYEGFRCDDINNGGPGCLERKFEATENRAPSGQAEFDLLGDIKSQVARNAIKKITDILAARLAEHYDGSPYYLIPEALEEYKNDLEILVNLGA